MSEKNQVRIMEVVPYNLKWKEQYINESEKIKDIMQSEIINIYHIGSTSIPNICAKPVIDIMVEVKQIDNVDKYNNQMEALGYIVADENGIKGRRFFLKGEFNRTHHVHIFQVGNPEINKHLNFRDYMISHPEEAEKYGQLKKELAEKFRYDSLGYVDGKNDFIKDIDRKAEIWYKQTRGE